MACLLYAAGVLTQAGQIYEYIKIFSFVSIYLKINEKIKKNILLKFWSCNSFPSHAKQIIYLISWFLKLWFSQFLLFFFIYIFISFHHTGGGRRRSNNSIGMRALKRPNSDTDKDIVFLKTICHGQKFRPAKKNNHCAVKTRSIQGFTLTKQALQEARHFRVKL